MKEIVFFIPLVVVALLFLWVATKPRNSEYMDIFNASDTNYGQHFKACFKRTGRGPEAPKGKPVIISKSLLNLIPLLLFFLLTVIAARLFLRSGLLAFNDGDFFAGLVQLLLFLGPLCIFVYYLVIMSSKVYVYQNCMVIKNCYKKQVFYYNQLDSIESGIDFVKVPVSQADEGSWPGGYAYLIYGLIRNGEAVFILGANQYKNLDMLEKVFTLDNPYVESMENTGLQKPEDIKGYFDRVEQAVIAEYVDKPNPETGFYAKHFKVTFRRKDYPLSQLTGEPVIITTPRRNLIFLLLLGLLIACIILFYVEPDMLPFVEKPSPRYRRIPDIYNGDPLSFYGICLLLFLLLPVILFFISLGRFTSKIFVYRNGMVIKNCYTKRILYYNQFDALESDIDLERATAVWGDGSVPLIYKFMQNGQAVVTLNSSHYANLSDLETVFTEENPYVEAVINTTLTENKAAV